MFRTIIFLFILLCLNGCGNGSEPSLANGPVTDNSIKTCPRELVSDFDHLQSILEKNAATTKKYSDRFFLFQSERNEVLSSMNDAFSTCMAYVTKYRDKVPCKGESDYVLTASNIDKMNSICERIEKLVKEVE